MRRLAAALALCLAAGAAAAETRPAIIDTAWDTRPYLADLRAAGVQVVARYLARCPQPERNIPQKRLIDQGDAATRGSEVNALLDGGFAILSIYQYNNDSPNKFRGRDQDGNPLPDGDCRPTRTPRTAAQEGELDARAAVAQAKALGQPRGSAIYFGVDIAFSAGDAPTRRAVVEYMRTVRDIVRRGGYTLGAYGNGDALEVLEAEGLIEHTWLSASRAYPGTTRYHNGGRWHLFQHGVNLEWFTGAPGACRRGLGLDTNIQNAAHADRPLGVWSARGVVRVAPERTRAVYAAHRFACDGDARIRRTADSGAGDLISATSVCRGGRAVAHAGTVDYANAARVGRTAGSLVEVDYDHDGRFDGWTAAANLTPSFGVKPEWIRDRGARRGARCR